MNTSAQSAAQPKLPTNIPEYLEHLRRSLAGADPALIQDALYDAEEYLRSEMAEHPSLSEADVIAQVASSYGAPEEVADIYRDTEVKVQTALRPPVAKPQRSVLGRFFGVIAEPRAYAALFYMLLSMPIGIFYFAWVTTGLSISACLAILIIGVPFAILYFGSVRVLSLVEGRIVETLLGERMPRRPLYAERSKPLLKRVGEMFTDPRTWTTQLYFLLKLPLGIFYFMIAVTLLSVSIAFITAPVTVWLGYAQVLERDRDEWMMLGSHDGIVGTSLNAMSLPLVFVVGFLLLFATLHIARGIGYLHGQFAKHLLVHSSAG